ncbi:MAG: putative box helicase domain protein [Candidatus Saccharibacteria bacterium]|nr:putative box helicase domain protein [Candidatus Saccharibacteria bacterium]
MASYKYSVYNSAKQGNRGGGGGRGRSGGGNKRRGEYIDPARFVQAAKPIEETQYEAKHRFADFEVASIIHDNLTAKGYEFPSAIQDQTIPMALEGHDMIGIANTGTGKTAAFGIPIAHALITRQNAKALIVAPTRELAQQIEDEMRSIGKGGGFTGALLIGGTGMGSQLRDLRNKPRIVIGTPGRIKDHMERGTLKLDQFNMVVLDEVDRMLDMGFVNDVSSILDEMNPIRQSFFFSATMDPRVQGLIRTFSKDPQTVSVKSGDSSQNVNQDIVRASGTSEKMAKLHDILLDEKVGKVIVFDETQRSVERLSNELIARGFSADAIHGGKSQGQRQRALDSFKASRTKILVATDVAARGIDVADISHVINFSQPQSYQDYVHRIGRAGRAGKIGHALTFVG